MLDLESLDLLKAAARHLDAGFATLPDFQPPAMDETMASVLMEVAHRLHDNFPYPHPMYAGQMLKPPHPVARLAYALAMWINPNNHALDGGRASSAMEKEAVAELAGMFGWESYLGHLCGGGTVANLEALWVASRLAPGQTVLASSQAHYTHSRMCGVLDVPFESVPVDRFGRMDVTVLQARLRQGDVGTVVATVGTTALGAVDPLPRILELAHDHGVRVHVDTAYGGYFKVARGLGAVAEDAYAVIDQADSIVVDPHKHGLQPYGCGCVLFRDPEVGRLYRHDSPYTYFTSSELHLGEISMECSRPGAAAVALWATQRLLPLKAGGEFAQGLEASLRAARDFWWRLDEAEAFRTAMPPELDIVVWVPVGGSASEISARSQAVFDAAAAHDLHLALTRFPRGLLQDWWPDIEWDEEQVTCLRACLMKPEHATWLDRIWEALVAAAASA